MTFPCLPRWTQPNSCEYFGVPASSHWTSEPHRLHLCSLLHRLHEWLQLFLFPILRCVTLSEMSIFVSLVGKLLSWISLQVFVISYGQVTWLTTHAFPTSLTLLIYAIRTPCQCYGYLLISECTPFQRATRNRFSRFTWSSCQGC